MKRCSLVISEIQIKTTMRYHFTPDRMTFIKKSGDNNADVDVEIKEDLCSAGRIENWCSHYENRIEDPQNVDNRTPE